MLLFENCLPVRREVGECKFRSLIIGNALETGMLPERGVGGYADDGLVPSEWQVVKGVDGARTTLPLHFKHLCFKPVELVSETRLLRRPLRVGR